MLFLLCRRYSALLRGTIVFIGAFFLNTVLEYFGIPTCTTMTTVELPRAILCVLPVSALFGIVLGFRGVSRLGLGSGIAVSHALAPLFPSFPTAALYSL